MAKTTFINSPYSQDALTLLGQLIREGRIARRMTAAELCERAGVSRPLLYRIERGDPHCAIGAVFEVATIAGVPLFEAEPSRLAERRAVHSEKLALLPKAIRHGSPQEVPDDF
jgi:transcriptional regulator with XRE-family HTH domain